MKRKKEKKTFNPFDENIANYLQDCDSPLRHLMCQIMDCAKIDCKTKKPHEDEKSPSNEASTDTQ